MPSSNDRKISQLPLLTELKEDTTFLVVSDVGSTPKNERMHAQTLFDQIPSTLTIGQELDGKDVVFNTTLNATNRFHFDSLTGDLNLGHNLNVANSVSITQDLYCSGNVHFDSFTPNFANLEIDGDFLCGGNQAVGNNLTVLQDTDLQNDLFVRNDAHISNNLYVTELASIDKLHNNTFEGLNANLTFASIASIETNSISAKTSYAEKLSVETSITSNGYISIVGNITGDIGSFAGMNITNDVTVGGTVTANMLVGSTSISTPSLSTQTLYSDSLSTLSGTITTLNSTTGTVETLNSNNVISIDVTAQQNLSAEHMTANTVDIVHFSSENFNANVISANNVNTNITITDLVQAKVYTTRPNATNLSYGTMIVYNDSSDNLSLEILMPDASNNPEWKRIFLGNPVPA